VWLVKENRGKQLSVSRRQNGKNRRAREKQLGQESQRQKVGARESQPEKLPEGEDGQLEPGRAQLRRKQREDVVDREKLQLDVDQNLR